MIYPMFYNQPYPTTVGAPTYNQVIQKWGPWFAALLVLVAVISIYVRLIDPKLLRDKLLKQRQMIIKLGYLEVAGKRMTGPQAQDWVNKQLSASGDMFEDPLFDVENIRPGKQALWKD
jgi:hypothetical protein